LQTLPANTAATAPLCISRAPFYPIDIVLNGNLHEYFLKEITLFMAIILNSLDVQEDNSTNVPMVTKKKTYELKNRGTLAFLIDKWIISLLNY